MAYFDYGTPALPDLSEGISKMGDALTQTLAARRQQKQFEAQQQLQREVEDRKWQQQENQYAIQNRAANRLEERQNIENARADAEYQEKVGGKITKALAEANPQEAQRIANAAVIVDPKTGQRVQVKLTPGQTPDVGPEPVAQPSSQRPPDAGEATPVPPELAAIRAAKLAKLNLTEPTLGPRASAPSLFKRPVGAINPDDRSDEYMAGQTSGLNLGSDPALRMQRDSMRDIVREQRRDAGSEVDRAAAQQQFDERQAGIGKEHDQWLAKKHKAEMDTPYTLQFGNGPATPIDVPTQRYAARSQNAADFTNSLPPAMQATPAAERARAMILGGEPLSAAIGAFHKEVEQGTALQASHEEGLLRDKNRIDVATINARKPSFVLQERRLQSGEDRDRRKETRGDIEHWLKASGLADAPNQIATLGRSARQLSGTNGKEQMAAMVGMGRATQGSGPWSDRDQKVFVDHGGVGLLDQWDGNVQKLIDGQYGDAQLEQSRGMLRGLQAVLDDRLRQAADDGRQEFVQNDIYDPSVAESVLEQRLGKDYYQRTMPRQRAGGPLPPEAKGGKKKAAAGGPTSQTFSGTLPPGAILGKKDGKRGYALDGKFIPLE